MSDFAEAIRIARQYVTTICLNISLKNEAPFIIDYKKKEKGKAFDLYPFFSTLKKSAETPGSNYLLQDYDELEEKRLRPAEHLLMLDAVSNLTLKIEENNKNLIETMNKNTILHIEAIKGIRKSGESKESSDSNII
ncbi:15776_t:CDS:2, partial [Funneliformis caledonium]